MKGWLADLEGLAAVPAERVVPGHGPVGLAWPPALDQERTYLAGLAKDVKVSIAKGEPLEGAEEMGGTS